MRDAMKNIDAKKVLEFGQQWGAELRHLQDLLEGPTPLRTASGLVGFALAAGTLFSLRHIIGHMTDPPVLVLKAYTILFGMVIFANELKSGASEKLESLRQFTFKYFPFLSVMAGKGLFMVFVGSIGLAFHHEIEVTIPAICVAAVGLAYLCTHFAKRNEVGPAIERSMNLHAASCYEPLRP